MMLCDKNILFTNDKKTTLLFALLSTCFSLGQTIDSTHLEKINNAKKIIAQFIKVEKTPGLSVSVSKNEKLIWSEGFGVSNIETKRKLYQMKLNLELQVFLNQ